MTGSRSSHRKCSIKKVFLKILQNSQENKVPEPLFYLNCRPQPSGPSGFWPQPGDSFWGSYIHSLPRLVWWWIKWKQIRKGKMLFVWRLLMTNLLLMLCLRNSICTLAFLFFCWRSRASLYLLYLLRKQDWEVFFKNFSSFC